MRVFLLVHFHSVLQKNNAENFVIFFYFTFKEILVLLEIGFIEEMSTT